MPAHLIHDTKTIIAVDENACYLFRCEPDALHDRSLLDLISDPDFQGLARWRLKHIREKGELRSQKLPFLRFDGTVFWGEVQTRRIDDRTFESTVTYIDEY